MARSRLDVPGVPTVADTAAGREVEWQFDSVDLRPVERWLHAGTSGVTLATPGRVRRLVDVYADTADWRLFRGGYALRCRRRAGELEVTLKSLAPPKEGPGRRTDMSATAPKTEVGVPGDIEGPLGRRIRALTGTHELRPLVQIRTRRTSFDLEIDGVMIGEIALVATTIPMDVGRGPARLQRVEVEVRAEAVDRIRPFVTSLRDACNLVPASLSKLEAGLFAAGYSPADEFDFGPTEIHGGLSCGELAFAVLRRDFFTFLNKEPGTRLGEDPEELHDMRVATRRIRAALGLFAYALPVRGARFQDEFRWISDALGRVRDLDVQLGELGGWERNLPEPDRPALEVMRSQLDEQRREAATAMLAALDSTRYDRLAVSFSAFLRRGPLRRSVASRASILAVAPDMLQRRYRKVRRAAKAIHPGSPPAEYHALRIRAKRLRYALEFVEPLFGAPARRLVERLVDLQDLLGKHQDAEVATKRLRSLVETLGDELPPATVFAMGRVDERYEVAATRLRRRFPERYRPVGKRWRGLNRRMLARRPPSVAGTSTRSSTPARLPERPSSAGGDPGPDHEIGGTG